MLQRVYKLTIEDYINMVNEQSNLCAICGKPEKDNKVLSIDHNHETGEIRGLLCNSCNTGIGHLKEKIEILEKAITYLNKYNKK